MKNIIALLLTFTLIIFAYGQEPLIPTPWLSPLEKKQIKIGITDVDLVYSRPSMRGRTIFGELVPYDKIWRTGANINNKITFAGSVLIDGKKISAGTYSIFTKPNPDKWEIYFHTELDEFGVPEVLEEKNIVLRFSVAPTSTSQSIETFTIGFDNLTQRSATLSLAWENTYIPILIEAPMDELMSNKLNKASKTLASDYATAAWNYFDIEKNPKKAIEAVNYSITLTEKDKTFTEWLAEIDLEDWRLPWAYLIKSEMHAELGEMKEALESAQRSLKIAEKINEGQGSIKRIKANIVKWK